MTNHCAVACPVVTEAVKAATPESKIAMALAAIESDKIGIRAAAERFGVPAMNLSRAKDKTTTVPIGTVVDLCSMPTIGKDGKSRRPPATTEEILKAWEKKDAGASIQAIAFDLKRGEVTIRNWFKKPRLEPAATLNPPPLILGSPVAAPKPNRPQIPDNLKQLNQKERKWLRERWIQIADHLVKAEQLIRLEHSRLQSEYAGPQGSLMMVNRWAALAKLWADSGELQDFAVVTGNAEAVSLAGFFSELERSSRVSSQLIGSIETWTGCKPDPTRYQPTP